MSPKARINSKTGRLNVHVQEDGLYCVQMAIGSRENKQRTRKRFVDLDEAIAWRDLTRRRLGLPPAEDDE